MEQDNINNNINNNINEIPNSLNPPFQEEKKNKKNMKMLGIVSVIVLSISFLFVIIIPIVKTIRNDLTGPSTSDFIAYLTTKYEGEKFYYVEDSTYSVWFNAGFITKDFSSDSFNDSFEVRADKHNNETFSDQYYLVKYKDELNEHYYEKYGKYFENLIPYKYSISVDTIYPYFNSSEKQTSFEQVISDIENSKTYSWAGKDIYIDADYETVGSKNINSTEFDLIESQIDDLILEKEIQLGDKDTVHFRILMTGSDQATLCPDKFVASKSSDEKIEYCSLKLYPKRDQ